MHDLCIYVFLYGCLWLHGLQIRLDFAKIALFWCNEGDGFENYHPLGFVFGEQLVTDLMATQ